MSDLSSPTGQKNLCKTTVLFWGGGGWRIRYVPTSRTLHSRLALLFLGFLSPISLRQTYFGSSLLFAGREATTGNTSALRKLSQATVPLALFRLRNI